MPFRPWGGRSSREARKEAPTRASASDIVTLVLTTGVAAAGYWYAGWWGVAAAFAFAVILVGVVMSEVLG